MATTKRTHHTAARKAAAKSSTATKAGTRRKYSPKASEFVEEEMKEMNEGKLKSGGSGKKVTNPKQAIAIGLSEARKAGEKVPERPTRKAA
jgi:hypothetical protein